MFLFRIGWAKPVRINSEYYKNRRVGIFLVALAGPLMNFILAILALVSATLLYKFGYYFVLENPFGNLILYLLQFFAMINISLGIFNLIPIPPLDGSRIVGSFLSANAYIGYMKVERYGFYIIFGILALDRILSVVTGNPTLFSQALDFVYRFLFDGILKLKEAGIEVVVGVLEDEAKFLNRVFIKNITTQLPYVVLKTATTMDGKIATRSGDSKWITCAESRKEVYRMREEFDCILTSSNTVLADNPTMRVNEGQIKCILDKDNRTSKDAKIYQQGQIYVANCVNTPLKDGNLDLKAVLEELYKRGVCSVFVECGGKLAGAFLKENLVDEIYQFIAPKIVNDNSAKSCFDGENVEKIADCKKFRIYEAHLIGDDVLIKMALRPSLSGKPDISP